MYVRLKWYWPAYVDMAPWYYLTDVTGVAWWVKDYMRWWSMVLSPLGFWTTWGGGPWYYRLLGSGLHEVVVHGIIASWVLDYMRWWSMVLSPVGFWTTWGGGPWYYRLLGSGLHEVVVHGIIASWVLDYMRWWSMVLSPLGFWTTWGGGPWYYRLLGSGLHEVVVHGNRLLGSGLHEVVVHGCTLYLGQKIKMVLVCPTRLTSGNITGWCVMVWHVKTHQCSDTPILQLLYTPLLSDTLTRS